ncbi:hypothetical protein ACOMHN_043204 [Nucella lapillus]
MALRPVRRGFWDNPWEGMVQPSRLCDQHFGNTLCDDFFNHPVNYFPQSICPHLSHRMQMPVQSGISEVVNNEKEFRVTMDVQHFRPDEVNIKTKDNRVIIQAHHEEREDDHGFISREFTRQYVLPKDVDPDSVTSSLTRDGVLTLKAPKVSLEAPKERVIPITKEAEGGQDQQK